MRKDLNKTRDKYVLEERRQNQTETCRGSYYKQDARLEEFLDEKSAFYNGSESDDSDNGDENYNENCIWTISPEENCPPVRVMVWFRVKVRIRLGAVFLGGNCPRTNESIETVVRRCLHNRIKNFAKFRGKHQC